MVTKERAIDAYTLAEEIESLQITVAGKPARWNDAKHIVLRLIAEQPDVETEKWIPVTDHLPKNDYGTHWKERAYYLVRLSNGTMRVAHYGYKEYDWWIDSHDCVLSEKHYTEVTHWRHLPAQPKEG